HGPQGLKKIAQRIHTLTNHLAAGLQSAGYSLRHNSWFDTLTLETGNRQQDIHAKAAAAEINLRLVGDDALGISLNELSTPAQVNQLLALFGAAETSFDRDTASGLPAGYSRDTDFLTHPVFNSHHS